MEQNEKKEFTSPYATYLWLAIAAVLVLIFLSASGTTKSNQTNDVTLVVDYGASQRIWHGQFQDKVRAWDLLQQASMLSDTALVATGNFSPYQIDGHRNNGKEGWHFYLNGKLQTLSPFESFVSSGDEVAFRWQVYDATYPK